MQTLDEIGCSSKWLIYKTLAENIPSRSSTCGVPWVPGADLSEESHGRTGVQGLSVPGPCAGWDEKNIISDILNNHSWATCAWDLGVLFSFLIVAMMYILHIYNILYIYTLYMYVLSDVNIWHHRSETARLDMFIYDAALLAPWRFLLTSRSWLTQWSQCPKKTVFEWKNHEKSQLPNFAPTFGWFSLIFIDFQSCFLFSTPINARRIALGSSTNRSGRCWWAKKKPGLFNCLLNPTRVNIHPGFTWF